MIKYCLDSKIQKTAIFVIINNTMTPRTDKMLMFSYAHAFREITWEKCPVECHRIGPFKKLNKIIFRNWNGWSATTRRPKTCCFQVPMCWSICLCVIMTDTIRPPLIHILCSPWLGQQPAELCACMCVSVCVQWKQRQTSPQISQIIRLYPSTHIQNLKTHKQRYRLMLANHPVSPCVQEGNKRAKTEIWK